MVIRQDGGCGFIIFSRVGLQSILTREVNHKLTIRMTHKLPRSVIIRAAGLLEMLYSPIELAEDLSVPARTVREWIKNGMPFERDRRGHMWVNGMEFRRWVEETRTVRPRFQLGEDEAFCLRCRRRVKFSDPVVSDSSSALLLTGKCPFCGGTVNRGVKGDLSR